MPNAKIKIDKSTISQSIIVGGDNNIVTSHFQPHDQLPWQDICEALTRAEKASRVENIETQKAVHEAKAIAVERNGSKLKRFLKSHAIPIMRDSIVNALGSTVAGIFIAMITS